MTTSTRHAPPHPSRHDHWRAGCGESRTSGSAGGRAEKEPHTGLPRRAAHPTQAAKTHVGLDHYQCRGWRAWHRSTLLAMIALAILVIAALSQYPDHVDPRRDELVALSVGELRRLITADQHLTQPDRTIAIRWSWWRRRHQATARRSHYKRRDATTSP
jgi:hypothetical protein